MSLYNDQLLQGSDGIRDYNPGSPRLNSIKSCLETIGKYHVLRQLWLDLGVMLMEMNSNMFSRWWVKDRIMIDFKLPEFPERNYEKNPKERQA